MLFLRSLIPTLLIVTLISVVAIACTKGAYLPPLDRQLVAGAMRADALIVTRQDGGMPHADRLLAESACGNLAKVMEHAQDDAGMVCP